MKNFFRIVMLALVVCATSCAREDISSNLVGGGDAIEVTFTADLGELGTRTATVGDGSHVNRVYLGIYENNLPLNYLDNLTEDEGYLVTDGKATFSVVLLKDKVYDLVFWAQKAGLKTTEDKDVYNMDWAKRELTVDYTGVLSQAEERDAFYLVQNGFKAGHDETVFKLYRPFAQLNAGLSKVEVENITNNGVDVESLKSKAVVRKVANKLFLGQDNHGKIDKDNLVEVEFGSAAKPAEELKVSSAVTGGPFEYVSLNYLLVNEEQLVEVDYTFTDNEGTNTDNEGTNYERTYYSVPVKRNYRTNIVGALLSSPIDFTVEIVPEFTNSPEEDYNRVIWDGKSVSEPPYDATNKTYTVDEGSELAWLAAAVNGTLPDDSRATLAPQDFEGKTFVLSEDINLGGHDWTPISMSAKLSEKKTFRGTFDGQNHIISGLSVNQQEIAGLFGYVYAATIKNVIIDGASINSNHFAGGIVGWINNSKGNIQVPMVIENCHVKNSTIVSAAELVNGEWDNGDKVGGIVGYAHFGDADYAANEDAKIINCSVEETTIKAYRDFGGIAGYASHVALVNCTTSNVTLEQDLTNDYKAPDTPTTFSLTIGRDNGGNTVDGNEYIADGVCKNAEGFYCISTLPGLKWLVAQTNGGNTFAGKTIVLTADIDLLSEEWTPIGTSANPFKGTFDGQNHVISNLVITGSKSTVGLFSNTYNGHIKNLIVENAQVSGRLNVGVVAGNPYTSKYTNVTVQGLIQVEGMSYVGGVGGKNAYADWTKVTVNAAEGSYVKANSIENGTVYRTYVGGVSGFNGEGGHKFENITSNIDVIGTTCDVGGLFGIAHYGNKFVNCSCSGNVSITKAAEAADAEEMGGIAGVWHNQTGYTVSFDNCVFTGTLTANITEGLDLSDNTIVGKAYSASGKGVLLINGGQSLAGYPSIFVKDNEYMIFNLAGLKDLNKFFKNNRMANDTWGRTYSIGADIDATGYTWEGVYMVTGSNAVDGIVIEGNHHTISNLAIKDYLLTGTADGGDDDTAPGEINNLTLDNVTVKGGWFTSPLWGNLIGDLTYNNVHVVNSNITGTNNVGGLLASTGEGTDYYVVFNNCSVENTTITANGADGQDPTGASGFFGRAFAKAYVTFTGNNVVSGNTITNNNGLVGGEVYAYTTYTDNGFAATGACDTFTNWAGIAEVVSVSSATEMTDTNGKTGIIESGSVTTMTGDIATSAKDTDANSGYGATGIKVDGGILDGNGNTITVSNANSTWDCAVNTTGGTIKNLTVAGAMRGIFMGGAKADTYIDNVIFKDVVYTFNSDGGNKNYGVYISNSTLNGWTSFSDVHKEVVFTNCKFGKGSGYAYCRPYNETLFKNCEFAEGFTLEPLANIVLEGCTLNGVAITAENLSALVTNTSKVTLK